MSLPLVRKRVIQAARSSGLRALDRAYAFSRRSGEKRILLECSNSLMAAYVMRAFATVHQDPGVRGWITDFPGRHPGHVDEATQLGLTWVPTARAVLGNWDLVILADHAPFKYRPGIPKVILPHGPGPSRLVRGGSYYYDPTRALWPDGRRVYELMLDTSEAAAARGAEWLPEYEGRVRAVGDLLADELLELSRLRSNEERGRTVQRVGLMSTWGPHGLIANHGEWLLRAVRDMAERGRATFVISMHPRLWDVTVSGPRWATELRSVMSPRVRVLRPGESWLPAFAEVDAAITDHTSMAGLFSVLGRPLIPVEVPTQLLVPHTFTSWVYENMPTVSNASELEAALDDCERFRARGAPVVVDHLGSGRERTAAALREVLDNTAQDRSSDSGRSRA